MSPPQQACASCLRGDQDYHPGARSTDATECAEHLLETQMPPMHDLRMLLRYNAWANDRLFSALAALPGKRPAKSS